MSGRWKPIGAEDFRVRRGTEAQLERLASLTASGARRIGWKVGLDRGMRARLGVDSCAFGHLTDSAIFDSGSTHSLGGTLLPAVEAEIAVYVGREIPPDSELAAIRDGITGIGAALEIIDIRGRLEQLEQVLERNLFHRGVVFGGERVPYAPDGLGAVQVRSRVNKAPGWNLSAKEVQGDVAFAVGFMAESLCLFGEELRAGDRIITGSLTPLPIWVKPGDEVEVDFGPLGILSIRFAQ